MVHLENMPCETLVEVFKFLTYQELCEVQPIIALFNEIIQRHKHVLALKSFHQIEICPDTQVFLASYRKSLDIAGLFEDSFPASKAVDDIYRIELSDAQKEEWENALHEHIPLYSYPELPDSVLELPEENRLDSFITFISREEVPVPGQPRLCLELPLYPANMSDLFFARFWVEQLTRVHFRYSDGGRTFFNPEMLAILFDAEGPPIRFHSTRTWLRVGGLDEAHNQRAIQWAHKHVVTQCLGLRVRNYYEQILDFLLRGGARTAKVVFPSGPGHSTVELQNLLIYHAESSPRICDTMVSCIEFLNVNDLPWPDVRSAKKVEEGTAEDDLHFTKYELVNKFSDTGARFHISIGHFEGAKEFKRFTIQRMDI